MNCRKHRKYDRYSCPVCREAVKALVDKVCK